jgi:hypothetical protein
MAKILSLHGLKTLQAARQAERDVTLTQDRKLAARRGRNRDRLLAWQRSSDLDARAALAEALLACGMVSR